MSIFQPEELSDSEKLDYIYKRLKAQQRMAFFKAFAFITLAICAYIFIQFLTKPESEPVKKKMMLFAQEKIATFVSPIVSGILDSVMKDMVQKTTNSTGSTNIINPGYNVVTPETISGAENQNNPLSTENSGPRNNSGIETGNGVVGSISSGGNTISGPNTQMPATKPSDVVSPQNLPVVGGVQITPEMLDSVHKQLQQ